MSTNNVESRVRKLRLNDNTTYPSRKEVKLSEGNLGQTGNSAIELGDSALQFDQARQDQFGNLWVRFKFGGKAVCFSIAEYVDSETSVLRKLSSIGANLINSKTRNQLKGLLQGAQARGKIHVVDQPGYVFVDREDGSRNAVAYVFGSGKIKWANLKRRFPIIVSFERNCKVGRLGAFEEFEEQIGPIARGQGIPVLALSLSLAPLLQPFLPPSVYVENTIIELAGRSTACKTSIVKGISGACWGGELDSKNGYLENWNATVNYAEKLLPRFNNSFLGLDEAAALSGSPRLRGEGLSNFVHRFSQGQTKGRMGGVPSRPFQLIAISTSNQPISSIMQEEADVAEAILTRIITLYVPARTSGVFDHFPHGYKTLDELRTLLHGIANEHYGHAAPAMVDAVLKECQKGIKKLGRRIERLMNTFIKAAGISKSDGIARRRIKPFALAFASGVLAKKWKVIDGKLWGNFKEPLLRCWYMAQSGNVGQPASSRDRIFEYLRKNHASVIDLTKSRRPKLSDSKFLKVRVFVGRRRDGQLFAAFPPKKMKTRLPGFEAMFRKLRKDGHLIADIGSLQTKMRLRRRPPSNKPYLDRVYAINLDNWPID